MEAHPFILMILLRVLTTISLLMQGLIATNLNDEKLTLQKRLEIINKPATNSFLTKYGDILDCVDINKQPAFDHPLLRSHSIQVKPTRSIGLSKSPKSIGRRSSVSTPSQFLPKHMRCPHGTVPIKRIQTEDLLMEKFSPLLGTTPLFSASNGSNSIDGHEVAGIGAFTKNLGASGSINVWNPQVKADQYTASCVYVASEDGSVTNAIQTGWMVSPAVYPNSTETRLYGFWTKDSGKSTGCFNTICPGFVQVSKKAYLGQVITTISRKFHQQYFITVEIRQDIRTKDWWLYCGGEEVGYWPAALFSTLTDGATRAGWGGELYSPGTEEPPEMGSGYQADETGFGRVCLMTNLNMLAPQLFPQPQDVHIFMTNPTTYTVIHGNYGDHWGNFIYFGGPNKINNIFN